MSYVTLPADDGGGTVDSSASGAKRNANSTRWRRCFAIFGASWVVVASIAVGWIVYERLEPQQQAEWRRYALLGSIPIVALFFTWFHIWLAIQMMFRPLRFIGCCQFDEGVGLGWQGVVPRKALKMAQTAYQCARPHLLSPQVWFDRCDPVRMCSLVEADMRVLIHETLCSVGQKRYPGTFQKLPAPVIEEMTTAALEGCAQSSRDIWRDITNLLASKDGIDNDGMVIDLFTSNRGLLCDFFRRVGYKEFKFLEHTGAALGFFLGVIQLIAYEQLGSLGRAIFLPSTGFFLGIFTNWLAISVCFWPCMPYDVTICGCLTFRVQGLFLGRQHEASEMYSRMLTDNFFNFNYVVHYLQTQHRLWSQLKETYLRHNRLIFKQILGAARYVAPLAIGSAQLEAMREEVIMEMVARLSRAYSLHNTIAQYIETATDVHRDNTESMRAMSPVEFEGLLHPVFREDEWILILLGGILGAVVGLGQIYALGE